MQLSTPTRLETLFWEVKNRCFYVLLSFFLCFGISYQNSKALLYIFTLSYRSTNKIVHSFNESVTCFSKADLGGNALQQNFSPCSRYFFDFPFICFSEQGEGGISFADARAVDFKSNYLSFFNLLDKLKGYLASSKSTSAKLMQGQVETENLLEIVEKFEYQGKNFDGDFIASFPIDIFSIDFIFTDVEEAFSNVVLICFIFSFVSVLPIFIYESFAFFSSSLYFYESRKWSFRLVEIVLVWWFFIYNIQNYLIPKLTQFLLLFEISSSVLSISAETKISSYCSWVSNIWMVANFFFFLLVFFFFFAFSKLHRKISTGFSNSNLNLQHNLFRIWTPRLFLRYYFALKCNVEKNQNIKHNKKIAYSAQQNVRASRTTSATICILISALIAPPDGIQIVLAFFLFISFEVLICSWSITKFFIAKTRFF